MCVEMHERMKKLFFFRCAFLLSNANTEISSTLPHHLSTPWINVRLVRMMSHRDRKTEQKQMNVLYCEFTLIGCSHFSLNLINYLAKIAFGLVGFSLIHKFNAARVGCTEDRHSAWWCSDRMSKHQHYWHRLCLWMRLHMFLMLFINLSTLASTF